MAGRRAKAPQSEPQRKRSEARFGPASFALWLPVGFLLFLGSGALFKHLPPAIPAIYVVGSLVSAGLYARDKGRAQREEWRTPESVLHLFDFCAGWPGGLLAQRIWRHKTRKVSFQIIFWLCVVVHLGVWGWIFVRVPAETDLLRFASHSVGALKVELFGSSRR